MKKYLFIIILFLSKTSYSQENRTKAKFMDTCKISIQISKIISKSQYSDSINKITSNCSETTYSLKLYDRWGNSILSTKNISEKINWKELPKGNFFWIVVIIYPNGKKEKFSDIIEISD